MPKGTPRLVLRTLAHYWRIVCSSSFRLGLGLLCGLVHCSFAEISVVATVDQNRVVSGDSFGYSITVKGVQGGVQPNIPKIEGLSFQGPSTQVSTTWINNQVSQSLVFQYRVTPTRTGEFVIPAVEIEVGGKKYATEPIKIVVEKNAGEDALKQSLYAKVRLDSPQVFVGQTAPLDVWLFIREDVPWKQVSAFDHEAEGLGYRFLPNLKKGSKVVDGVNFTVLVVEGAISPTKTGKLTFGPCILKTQLRVQRKGGGGPFNDPFFESFFGNAEVREYPVTLDPVPIEVLPLPEPGRPADFAGAVGQWKLEVSAKPTEVAVGDPITLTAKIKGEGNIDTVPPIRLGDLTEFKTYEPTSKTTKNDLGTQGERTFEQVLIAKDVTVKRLPEIRFSFFNPRTKQYEVARRDPIPLVVKAGSTGQTTIVGGGAPVRPKEKLGQDIVYIKGNLGPVAAVTPFVKTGGFLALNVFPVVALVGAVAWKRRVDKLRGDMAYARRSRAAKQARRLLAETGSFDQVQRALQSYLGDRLNIPASGITVAIVDDQLLPRGLKADLAEELKGCFEACDTARFAGGSGGADVATLRERVERLIDEIEKIQL